MLLPFHFPAPGTFRKNFWVIVIASILSLLLLRQYTKDSNIAARERRLKLTLQFEEQDKDSEDATALHTAVTSSLTVHLVIATTASEDISWTSQLRIPGLQVIHYVADDHLATYHPPANKGREAMMYHSYFYDFYDHLPDIVILTHAEDISWHMEPLLSHSLAYAISHLDLLAVKERGYANLRVSWENACPAHINTTRRGASGLELEEQSTRQAFLGSFGNTSRLLDEVPEILAQPCCSQFAVTKEVIRSVSREQYGRFINWLLTASMDDYMLGRTWEHMFQWLFARKAIDCPVEWKTYCKMYHICFDGKKEYEEYSYLDNLRAELIDRFDVAPLKTLWNLAFGVRKKDLIQEISVVTQRINELKQAALVRGKEEMKRTISRELYLDD